jgi:phenylacetate-CoA ligase
MTMSHFEPFRRRIQSEVLARMPDHVARLTWSAERIASHQRDALRRLLAHAATHSRFHARRLRGVDPTTFELADLPRLPIMTKDEMMAELGDVLTDPRLSHALVEETLARTGDTPIPLFDEFLCQASGGSSGRRGVFVLDAEAVVEFPCSLMRPLMARIAREGGGATTGIRRALVAAGSAIHATGMPPKLMEGSPLQVMAAPATLPLADIVERLNAIQPDALVGYASMLARLAAERQAGRLRIAPKALTSTSETLLAEQRTAIREAFDAPLVDTFGSSEGLVGVSDPDDPVFNFASDLCVVELVDERDRPVPPGEPSAKILVTNLYNRAQPLIRYAIEDSFLRAPDAATHGHLRARVQGRTDDVLHYGRVDVHPLAIRSVMVKTPEVVDYQVRQTAAGIDVSVVAEGALDRDRLRERLRTALGEAGLTDAVVEIRPTSSLERQAETGKLRRFVPLAPDGERSSVACVTPEHRASPAR